MVKYLKKKRLYQIAKTLIKEEIPLCKDFDYRFFDGAEWLERGEYKISSQFGGNWIKIVYRRYDELKDDYSISYEIYSEKKGNSYLYHSINGEVVD